MLDGNERNCPRAGHQCDFAEVDAAADDDEPHSQPQDPENGYAPDESENVLRGGKAGQGQRENDQKQHGDNADDLLLAELAQTAPRAMLCRVRRS